MDLEALRSEMERRIPARRFLHVLGVEKQAVLYAKRLGEDVEKAAAAALLHDVTKCCTDEEHMAIAKKYNVPMTELERKSPKLYHAITGAAVAKYELGITDEEILQAIYYHATAKEGMSTLCKIVYLADFTEENRDYEGVEEIRKQVEESFEGGYLYALEYTIYELMGKKVLIHPQTLAARNEARMKQMG